MMSAAMGGGDGVIGYSPPVRSKTTFFMKFPNLIN